LTIQEIIAAQQAIVDAADAEKRSMTDAEATQFETLEVEGKALQRTNEIRSRQAAYVAPNASLAAVVNVATDKPDNTLDRAFGEFLRTGVPNADIAELRAQGSGDSAGGYMIAPAFQQKLVVVQKAFGGLAAEVQTINTDTGAALEYPSNDDTSASGTITAESAAFSSGTDLTFGTVALSAIKYTSSGASNLPLRVPVELLQDAAFDVESYIAKALGTRIARKQAVDWTVGTGSGMPFGIAHAGLTEDKALTTTTTITYNDLLDLEAKLDPAYEQNAKWVFNKATWVAVRKLVDDNGRPLIFDQAASGISGAPQKTLLGYPVILDQQMPSAAGDSTNFAVLGDLAEAYVIRRVAALTVIVNPWTRAGNGEVEFVAWERADGNIQNRKAYTVLATQDV
jgi:HK97 family phage major capsid protein